MWFMKIFSKEEDYYGNNGSKNKEKNLSWNEQRKKL
jgi:hypothetical protein